MSQTTPRERLSLRAHHLLCLHGFRGLGYDERFVRNMTAIHDLLRTRAVTEIVVTDEPDDICAACPHMAQGCCERDYPESKVGAKELDRRVLRLLEIEPGRAFGPDELLSLVRARISPDDLAVVCEGCEWLPFDYCVEGLGRKCLEGESLS